MGEELQSAESFYNNKIFEINKANELQDIKAKYGTDISDFLNERRRTNESNEIKQDIIDIALSEKDHIQLIKYIQILLNQATEENNRDNRVQLSNLKTELEKNISSPNFEIFSGSINGKSFNLLDWKTRDYKRNTGEITVKETPINSWYHVKYDGNKDIYIKYESRDKISFYRDLDSGYLGSGDINVKKVERTSGQYNRNGKIETARYEENVDVNFRIRRLNLNLKMKFYTYGDKD